MSCQECIVVYPCLCKDCCAREVGKFAKSCPIWNTIKFKRIVFQPYDNSRKAGIYQIKNYPSIQYNPKNNSLVHSHYIFGAKITEQTSTQHCSDLIKYVTDHASKHGLFFHKQKHVIKKKTKI